MGMLHIIVGPLDYMGSGESDNACQYRPSWRTVDRPMYRGAWNSSGKNGRGFDINCIKEQKTLNILS